MPRLLSLFDGTGSISTRFREGGWEVISLDLDPSCGASVTEDVLQWDYLSEPPFQALFAACPCEAYSQANTRGTRNLVLADSLVAKTWEIVQHFKHLNPEVLFFIENPDSSWLWKRPVSAPFPHHVRLDFCQYGFKYRKRTRIATNVLDYMPRPLCNPKSCLACHAGRHVKSAQRGPSRSRGVLALHDECSLAQLHSYPPAWVSELFEYLSAKLLVPRVQ
jgi:hypothetical protein